MIPRMSTYLRVVVFGILLGIMMSFVPLFWRNLPQEGKITQLDGQVFGGDFVTFYLAGKIFSENRNSLYDLEFQRATRKAFLDQNHVEKSPELPFVYPILVAAVFSLLAHLPFITAFFLWSFCSLLFGGGLFVALLRQLGLISTRQIPFIILLTLGFPPFGINTLMGGQLSAIGLAIFSAIFIALLRDRHTLAGFILSFSYYKPPLFLISLICLVITQPLRFLKGFLSGATLLIGLSLLAGGVSGLYSYIGAASRYLYGREVLSGVQLPPRQGAGLFGALVQMIPHPTASALVLLMLYGIVIWMFITVFRPISQQHQMVTYALLCCASVGLSVQCIRYDLAMMLVPFALIFRFQSALSLGYRFVLFGLIGAFYGEFCFREIPVADGFYNLSSFLFLPLIGILLLIARGDYLTSEEEKGNGADVI